MTNQANAMHEKYPDTHHDTYSKTLFGFWLYILSDFMLFATFFAVYVVLRKSTYGGLTQADIFNVPFNFAQTLVLLTSAFTIGIANIYVHKSHKIKTIFWMAITFALGLSFLILHSVDISRLMEMGYNWQRSAFLSAFYNLIGMHGIHTIFGLLWMIVLLVPVFRHGLTKTSVRRLSCLTMFWQFLNLVWLFIFTLVYLVGAN
ncbi:MAG: cytochrome c oxidase subunit 3 [Simkaniaceae bacterium]|nr:cytochrome c oxidase subunit 3 [Simkaniaceae bacterium]MCF7852825.1 cytochrome c oxidase subunit 3 [Simkaniaceae bacterium]